MTRMGYLFCSVILFCCASIFCMGKTHYDSLEVKKGASLDVIKRQYRQLAKMYHPDKSNLPNAQEKFIEISSAYEVLSDPVKRKEYDDSLAYPQNNFGGQSRHPAQGFQHFHPFQHFQQQAPQHNNGYHYTEFRTPDGRVFRTYSYNYGHAQYVQSASLPAILFDLLWSSPIPFFLFLYALYQLISYCMAPVVAKRQRVDERRNDRNQNGTTENISPNTSTTNSEGHNSSGQSRSTAHVSSLMTVSEAVTQRKLIALISCTAVAARLLSRLQARYRADPVLFIQNDHISKAGAATLWKDQQKVLVIATSKGGLKWTSLQINLSEPDEKQTLNAVDNWISKLVTGQAGWTDSLEKELPSILSLDKTTD